MTGRYLAGLSALALVSCNQASGADDRICETAPVEIAQGEWGACVHKWAYRLAGSPDPARTVADAVVSGCSDAIAWQINNGDVSLFAETGVDVGEARRTLGARIMDSAPKLALFRVVQARAGNCEIP